VALGAAPRPRGAPAGVQARDRPGPGSGRNPAGSRGPSASDRASARRPADSCVLPVLVASKDRTQLGQPLGAVLVRFGAPMCNVTPEREQRHPLGPRSRPRERS
jgi:hypothetical protein